LAVRGHPQAFEYSSWRAHRFKQLASGTECFGIAEKQVPGLPQSEVQAVQDALLRLGLEVDEQITTAADVDSREGRIPKEVLRSVYDGVANLFFNAIGMLIGIKEPIQPL